MNAFYLLISPTDNDEVIKLRVRILELFASINQVLLEIIYFAGIVSIDFYSLVRFKNAHIFAGKNCAGYIRVYKKGLLKM